MKCPYCLSPASRVVDKRGVADLDAIRRRRECLTCGRRYTTYERIETVAISVIKKDGRREAFDRDKLMGGLLKACEKRPVPRQSIEKLVGEVEAELRYHGSMEVPSSAIGALVTDRLRDLDKVAYIRFASVYREFTDLKSFEVELRKLKRITSKLEQRQGGESLGQDDSGYPQAGREGRPVRPAEDHQRNLARRPGGGGKRSREG